MMADFCHLGTDARDKDKMKMSVEHCLGPQLCLDLLSTVCNVHHKCSVSEADQLLWLGLWPLLSCFCSQTEQRNCEARSILRHNCGGEKVNFCVLWELWFLSTHSWCQSCWSVLQYVVYSWLVIFFMPFLRLGLATCYALGSPHLKPFLRVLRRFSPLCSSIVSIVFSTVTFPKRLLM